MEADPSPTKVRFLLPYTTWTLALPYIHAYYL